MDTKAGTITPPRTSPVRFATRLVGNGNDAHTEIGTASARSGSAPIQLETLATNGDAASRTADSERRAHFATIDREALFAEFRPLVQRLMRQYGTEPELRQDLQGEIYCQFCQHLEAFDPARGVPLRPYLVRQLTASMYTYARGQWRRQKRETGLELWVETLRSPDPSRQWDQKLDQERTAQCLPAAIAALPARQRNVVIWRYYEERSFEEIAAVLNVQVATARSLLRHGLNNLRKTLGTASCFSE